MLPSFTYLLFFWFLGELLKCIFNIPLSGSIVGMLLLFCALQFKIVKIESVNRSSEFLLKHLILFFIPFGVGIMVFIPKIKPYILPLMIGIIVSTYLTMFIVALVFKRMKKS